MPRRQLIELHEQSWFPTTLRDYVTDLLEFFNRTGDAFGPLAPKLAAAMEATGEREILDLCSGGGGPWRYLGTALGASLGFEPQVVLSDLYPNLPAFQRIEAESTGQVVPAASPVDATAVAPDRPGFRTLFESFHHFPPDLARAILQDAVHCRRGIGVFEMTARTLPTMAMIGAGPLAVLGATPFVRPARLSRFFWTYAVPILPAVTLVDGLVSCLRTYTPGELREMTGSLDGPAYDWDIGHAYAGRFPLRVTYAIGVPR